MPTPIIQTCALCLRGFEGGVTLNGRSKHTRKIRNIFLDNLKPNLSAADFAFNFDWSYFKEVIPALCFCRNCFKAGQRLQRMNKRLKEIETKIQRYVHQLSKEILKHWQRSEILGPCQSEGNNDQQFGNQDIHLNMVNEAIGLFGLNVGNQDIDLNNVSNEYSDINLENKAIDLNATNEAVDLNATHEAVDHNVTIEAVDLNMTNEDIDLNIANGDIDLNMENEDIVMVNESDFPLDLATVSQNSQQRDDFEEPHPIENVYFFPNSWDDEYDTHENMTIPQQDPNNSEEDVSNKNSNGIDDLLSQIKSRRLLVSLERLQLDMNGRKIPKVPINIRTEVETLNAEDPPKRPQTLKRRHIPKRRYRTVYNKRKSKKFSKEKNQESFSDASSSSDESDENSVSDGDFVPKKKHLNESRRSSSKTQNTKAKRENKGRYKCNQCGVTFFKKYTKESHMLQLHGDILIRCVDCYDRFHDNASLREHIKTMHTDKALICKSCPELSEFTNDYEFKVHCMSHKGEIPYECSKCNQKFASVNNYCEHQKWSPCAMSDGKFKCEQCDDAFKAKLLLCVHEVVRHNQLEAITSRKGFPLYCCGICIDGKRMTKLNLESHYAEHTHEFVYSCDICGKGFKTIENFTIHRKTHISSISYHCQFCDFTTHCSKSSKRHTKVSHTEVDNNEYACKECGKKFVGKQKLAYHKYHCGKKVFCEICRKMIGSGSVFNHNKYYHSDLPEQTCPTCKKQFTSFLALKQHQKTQHINVRYICEICGSVLATKEAHDLHLQSHEGKTHDCQICSQKFPSDYRLNEHQKEIHNSGKNLSCRYCSEFFVTYARRRHHEFSVHAKIIKREFKCSDCDMTFATPQLRIGHRKKMHTKN